MTMRQKRELQKRMKERRIRVIVTSFITVGLAILVACTAVNSYKEKQYKEELSQYYKYFTSVEVNWGDTVWTIYDKVCEDYPETATYHRDDFIKEVRSINHLNYDYDITSGENIVIPYFSSIYK